MKVLIINGSPNEKGCTYTALSEVADTLSKHGVGSDIVYLGKKPISGCIDCGVCAATGRCVINDKVNELLDVLDGYDGLIVGTPVYFSSATGQITSFLDRLFHAAGKRMRQKPAAAVVSCRRGGGTATFDQINKYFSIRSMPIVTSQYWNQVHGFTPEDVRKDREGMQTMRTLGENMAWLLKCIQAGSAAGVPQPHYEPQIMTNFIE